MAEEARSSPRRWVYRHGYNVRICHWINAIAFVFLVVSGVHVLLDFPELYWGEVGFRGHDAAFRLADWGLSWEEAGELGNRKWGRNYHFLFAWVFVLNGIVYLLWNLWTRHFRRDMVPARAELSAKHLQEDVREHLRFRPPRGVAAHRYNTLQKLSYLAIVFVLAPFMFFSGLAQMPAFEAIAPELIDLFGGRQTARTLHVICMVLMVLFLLVHIFQVFVAGVVNEFRSMVTGRYALPEDEKP
jgi:thiosulfate reductase cytochrome b subunit